MEIADVYQFSFFRKPILNTEPLRAVGIIDIYRYIVGHYAMLPTAALRNLTNKAEAKRYKATHFDYCTFSGLFRKRREDDLLMQSRLYDDEKYVDKIVGSFTELAKMYNTVTANCNKNAETLNRNIQLTEKRYAAMMKLMQEKKSKTIEQPPIPQTIKALPRFIFMTYPWYLIKRMYRSKHFRQFLVICMACLLAVSVFLTIFLAYDNAQLREF